MPYAYGATINHEYVSAHLNIWLTFRHQMLRSSDPLAVPPVYDIMPPLILWLIEADSVPVACVDSEWVDEFTLLLTSDVVASKPVQVTLEYDGPDEGLCFRWDKQIEPFGPTLSEDIGAFIEVDPVAMALLDQSVKIASSPTFANLNISGLTSGKIPLVFTLGLLITSSEFSYVNDITKPQITIGSGGYATAVQGLLINPAENKESQLVLLSTGGAGCYIAMGTGNIIKMNFGFNRLYSLAFEINTGSSYYYSTEIFTAHAIGAGSKGKLGTFLSGTAAPAGSPSAGGSIPNGTYYYLVTSVDYDGTETTKSRSTQSAAKVFSGGNGTIVLSWAAIQGAVSYKVYRTQASGSYLTPCYLGTTTTPGYTDTAAAPSAGAPPNYVFGGFGNAFNPTGDSWIGAGGLWVSGGVTANSLKLSALPAIHANNAAAIAGGLVAGQLYRSGADPDILYIVH